jgi:hypothetical protein
MHSNSPMWKKTEGGGGVSVVYCFGPRVEARFFSAAQPSGQKTCSFCTMVVQ